MFRSGLFLALAACLASACSSLAVAQRAKKERPTPYVIMQMNNEFIVLKATDAKPREIQLQTEYNEAVKAHKLAEKEAKKNKEKFTQKPPVRPSIRYVGKQYKTEEEAQEAREKFVKEWEAQKAKKGKPKP